MLLSRPVPVVLIRSKASFVTRPSSSTLSHVNPSTNMPTMVDVTLKNVTYRVAKAKATVKLSTEVFNLISRVDRRDEIYSKKGPVFSSAIIAGVMAMKKTSELIPFCHQVNLDFCDIAIKIDDDEEQSLSVISIAKTSHKTGVEMEALVGATTASLCIYDMLKVRLI